MKTISNIVWTRRNQMPAKFPGIHKTREYELAIKIVCAAIIQQNINSYKTSICKRDELLEQAVIIAWKTTLSSVSTNCSFSTNQENHQIFSFEDRFGLIISTSNYWNNHWLEFWTQPSNIDFTLNNINYLT